MLLAAKLAAASALWSTPKDTCDMEHTQNHRHAQVKAMLKCAGCRAGELLSDKGSAHGVERC